VRPSDHVDADDPQVGAILTELVELVLALGGRLDPDAVIVERDHELLLELRAEDTPERPVVRVPPELLVPVGELDWVGEDLTLAGPHDHLPPPAAAALELMLELYRTCGKVRDFAATSPRVAAAGDEALAEALAGTRLADATVITADTRTAFLDSRVLSRRAVTEGDHGSVLMPLIDVMNHDPEGAEFLSGPPGIAVSCRRPLGDQQCFARYGVDRDPLDLAVSYGFTTDRACVVNSAPVDVELDGVHQLRIRRRAGVVVIGLRPSETPGGEWDAHAWLLGACGALSGGPAARGFTATTMFEVPGRTTAESVDLAP